MEAEKKDQPVSEAKPDLTMPFAIYEKMGFYRTRVLPPVNVTDELRKTIETDVMKWLANETSDRMTMYLSDKDGNPGEMLLFSRCLIYIKECANKWTVWVVAESTSWPSLIGFKVVTIGDNACRRIRLPNEVRSEGYNLPESERDPRDVQEELQGDFDQLMQRAANIGYNVRAAWHDEYGAPSSVAGGVSLTVEKRV